MAKFEVIIGHAAAMSGRSACRRQAVASVTGKTFHRGRQRGRVLATRDEDSVLPAAVALRDTRNLGILSA